MAELSKFHEELYVAFDAWNKFLNTTQLPKLHELYRVQQTAIHSILGLFLKKGIIRDDPYKGDSRLTEIETIATDEFAENEARTVVGLRLFKYEMSLDFLNNFYQFTTEGISLDRIKRLVQLNKTFDWKDLSLSSSQPNTRGLADLVVMIKNGSDGVSANMLSENLTRIVHDLESITKYLKEISDFHRNNYKNQVRKNIVDFLIRDRTFTMEDRAEFTRFIKSNFVSKMPKQQFFPELIEELVEEEIGPKKDELQRDILAKVKQHVTIPQDKKKPVINLKAFLFDSVRILGSISPQLDEIVKKIEENHLLIESQNKGFWHKFKILLRKAFSRAEEKLTIEFDLQEPGMQNREHFSFDYFTFIEDLRRRSRLYSAFAIKTYTKVVEAPEQKVLALVAQHIEEMKGIIKQLTGLDLYFKDNALDYNRQKVRGFKVEVSTIKNTVQKANQKRFEYVSLVEEQEQMKRLGIKP